MGRSQGSTVWQKGFDNVQLKRDKGSTFYSADCKFCGQAFTGQPGRLINHLLQVKGSGIQVCSQSLAKKDPDLEDAFQELRSLLQKQQNAASKPQQKQQTKASGASGSGSSSGVAGQLRSWLITSGRAGRRRPGRMGRAERSCLQPGGQQSLR